MNRVTRGRDKVERFSEIHFTLAQLKLTVFQEAVQVGQSGIRWKGFLLRAQRVRRRERPGSLRRSDVMVGEFGGSGAVIG